MANPGKLGSLLWWLCVPYFRHKTEASSSSSTRPNMQSNSKYLYSFGMACAAVLRTYGDMSVTDSLMASIMIGTIIDTRILERTRNALARISWFGSYKHSKPVFNTNYLLRDDYAPQRAGHASLPGPTAPLVTELLQLLVPGYGTVYRHISEMLTYCTVSSGSH